MDKITLKNIIVQLRNEGNSFQTISDTLKQKYNIERTRQACQSMYKRATSVENMDKESVKIKLTIDIIHLHSMGLSDLQIKRYIDSWYTGDEDYQEITIYKIRDTISKNSDYIFEVLNDKVETAASTIDNGNNTYDELLEALAYKGVYPVKSVLTAIIEKAVTLLIRNSAVTILSKAVNITEDTSLIKKIVVKHDLDISTGDVSKELNSVDYTETGIDTDTEADYTTTEVELSSTTDNAITVANDGRINSCDTYDLMTSSDSNMNQVVYVL